MKKNLSYSLHNPYANDEAIKHGAIWNNSMSPEFAIASDMNPGYTGGVINVTNVTTTSSAKDMKGGNSINHDRDGQHPVWRWSRELRTESVRRCESRQHLHDQEWHRRIERRAHTRVTVRR